MTGDPKSTWGADKLRREILDAELRRMNDADAARAAEEKARSAFAADFLHHHVGPEDLKHIRLLVEAAVRHGELRALVYTFPSALCTDDGRAINNALPSWPDTLQGKARELYDAFERHAKPLGYHMSAEIVTFPGGIPGDVGFYLSWAPPLADPTG